MIFVENICHHAPLLDIWKRLFFSNFLNTLPLISTNCKETQNVTTGFMLQHKAFIYGLCIILTLFDIIMVSRDLLWELKATLRVVA